MGRRVSEDIWSFSLQPLASVIVPPQRDSFSQKTIGLQVLLGHGGHDAPRRSSGSSPCYPSRARAAQPSVGALTGERGSLLRSAHVLPVIVEACLLRYIHRQSGPPARSLRIEGLPGHDPIRKTGRDAVADRLNNASSDSSSRILPWQYPSTRRCPTNRAPEGPTRRSASPGVAEVSLTMPRPWWLRRRGSASRTAAASSKTAARASGPPRPSPDRPSFSPGCGDINRPTLAKLNPGPDRPQEPPRRRPGIGGSGASR
jgi:hypothetical protein